MDIGGGGQKVEIRRSPFLKAFYAGGEGEELIFFRNLLDGSFLMLWGGGVA